jgi:GT2 family glycosyltransferase
MAQTCTREKINPEMSVESETVLSSDLVIEPTSRWPLELPDATIAAALASSIPQRRPAKPHGERGLVSIVILTLNGLAVTKLCLNSLLSNTDEPDYEIIVVDNGSTDGTRAFLLDLARMHSHVKLVFNDQNRGFAAGSNQGLSVATGEFLVLLNNDTIVPPGWLARLVRHLDDPAIGLAGPMTNRCGNEAQLDVRYRTYGEFLRVVSEIQNSSSGAVTEMRTAIMFCVAMRREVFKQVGLLDERFETGMFEDDDYAMRIRAAGYRVGCVDDVFIHHFGQASIGELAAAGTYGPLFHANRRRFEEKWGATWTPHEGRPKPEYERFRHRIRAVVEANVPCGATVLVATKGDDELIRCTGRDAWHFPQTETGDYAGHHPRDSSAAVHDLEALRARGAGFFLLPSTMFWWLDQYPGFKRHLADSFPNATINNEDCLLVSLHDRGSE